jgi:hypothetical protein
MRTRSFLVLLARILTLGFFFGPGLAPPPQRRVRLLASSRRLAVSDEGPSAVSRCAARLRLFFFTRTRASTRRNWASACTDEHGLPRAAASACLAIRFSWRRFAAGADFAGSLLACLTSVLSADFAVGFLAASASAGPPTSASAARHVSTANSLGLASPIGRRRA